MLIACTAHATMTNHSSWCRLIAHTTLIDQSTQLSLPTNYWIGFIDSPKLWLENIALLLRFLMMAWTNPEDDMEMSPCAIYTNDCGFREKITA